MCLEVFLEEKYREGRERREREKSLENYPATQTLFFFFQNEGSRCIYRLKLTLQLPADTICVLGQASGHYMCAGSGQWPLYVRRVGSD